MTGDVALMVMLGVEDDGDRSFHQNKHIRHKNKSFLQIQNGLNYLMVLAIGTSKGDSSGWEINSQITCKTRWPDTVSGGLQCSL